MHILKKRKKKQPKQQGQAVNFVITEALFFPSMRGVVGKFRVTHAPDYTGVNRDGSIVGGGLRQGGHRAESRHRTISSSVRYSFPPSDRAMMLALYPASPVESTSWEKPHTDLSLPLLYIEK